jgi:hypothetical protein
VSGAGTRGQISYTIKPVVHDETFYARQVAWVMMDAMVSRCGIAREGHATVHALLGTEGIA